MGLLDGLNLGGVLRGALGEVEAATLPAAINAVLANTQYRDLNGLVAALQKGGLNAQVQSWLGPGANLPITEDQLKAVLGNAQVQEFPRHLGLPVDATLKLGAISTGHRRQSEPERHDPDEIAAVRVDGHFFTGASMIPKSGYRFSENIMLKQNLRRRQ